VWAAVGARGRSEEWQNSDELPGTHCAAGSSFILVRLYGV